MNKKVFNIVNFYLIFLVIIVSAIGILSLYSAAGGHLHPWAMQQIFRIILGLLVFIVAAFVNVRFWFMKSYFIYLFVLLLLIFVELKGHIGMGAQRWIDLNFIRIQPSELMKIAIILTLAKYFHQNKNSSNHGKLSYYILPLLIMIMPAILVLRQPDLGTAILLLLCGFMLIFMSGISWQKTVISVSIIILSLPLIWMSLRLYQQNRILTFLNPEQNPLSGGYHIIQSMISIGSGGFWGKGFLQGTQSQLQFLPEKQTDFIFAHFCEEFGIIGGSSLIVLYILIISCLIKITFECQNIFSRLYGFSLAFLFFCYVFVNIGMVVGLLPIVGIPLPFMSYGGTAIISLMLGLGILLSCYNLKNRRLN